VTTKRQVAEELSARILAPLFRYVADLRGADALLAVLDQAGVPARARDARSWLTHAEFEAALAAVRAALADEDEFRAACAYEVERSYGPLVLLLRAVSVESVYKLMARTIRVVSRVSSFEVADLGGSQIWLRYTSPLRESRLMCLSRIAQIARLPTVSGHPVARVEERQCIARGDPCCEYLVRW